MSQLDLSDGTFVNPDNLDIGLFVTLFIFGQIYYFIISCYYMTNYRYEIDFHKQSRFGTSTLISKQSN